MAKKEMSAEERKMHKKLIPVNLIVFLLSVVAIVALVAAPLVKVDVGKFLSDSRTIAFVDEKIDKAVEDNVNDSSSVDYAPVVASIVKNVLSKAKGSIRLTGINAMHVAFAKGDAKGQMAMDYLLFGERALIDELSTSVAEGVVALFETEEGHTIIEDALLYSLVSSVANETPGIGSLSDENIHDLTEIMRGVSELQDGDTTALSEELVSEIESILGTQMSEHDRTSVATEVQRLYDEAAAQLDGAPVTLEAIVCVAISSNADLGGLNLGGLLGGLLGNSSGGSETQSKTFAVTYEEGEGEGGTEEPNEIVTTYEDLLHQMGYTEADKEELKESLRTALSDGIYGFLEGYKTYFGYYGYVFYVVLFFAGLWFIQALCAFIRLFTKNKRCAVWYSFLFNWIPAMVWVGLRLVPAILMRLIPALSTGTLASLGEALLSCIGSYTWIVGLSYLVLFVVAIVGACIKRKIKNKFGKKKKDEEKSQDGGKSASEKKEGYAAPAQNAGYGNPQAQSNPYANAQNGYGQSQPDLGTYNNGGRSSVGQGGFDYSGGTVDLGTYNDGGRR